MRTVKFGSNEKEFNLAQDISPISADKLQIAVAGGADIFADLDAAVSAYGGEVHEYEDGKEVSVFKGYASNPSIYATYYTIDGNPTKVYQIVLTKSQKEDIDAINASVSALASKTDDIEKTVSANKDDVASALEGVASLFEMMTANASAEDETEAKSGKASK